MPNGSDRSWDIPPNVESGKDGIADWARLANFKTLRRCFGVSKPSVLRGRPLSCRAIGAQEDSNRSSSGALIHSHGGKACIETIFRSPTWSEEADI